MSKKYPVIILPGWLLGSTRFQPLCTEFQQHGYKAYVVDFPGFEQGEKLFRPWTLSDYVAYLEKFIRENKLGKAIFVAHSFGGRVALKLLSQKPELASSLVLTGTPGYKSLGSTRLFFIAFIAKVGKEFMSLPPMSIFQDVARKLFYILIGARDMRQVKGYMKQTFINIVEENLEAYMKKLRIPTLLLWGSDDGLVSVSIAEKMQQTIAQSKLVVIPAGRHNFVYKEPIKFVEQVITFLESQ